MTEMNFDNKHKTLLVALLLALLLLSMEFYSWLAAHDNPGARRGHGRVTKAGLRAGAAQAAARLDAMRAAVARVQTPQQIAQWLPQTVEQWKVFGDTAIPVGTYEVVIDLSQRFKDAAGNRRFMPHILGVPGFEGIRIHEGNTTADTSGCILLGEYRATNITLGKSKEAFDLFFAKLDKALAAGDGVSIEVQNPASWERPPPGIL